MHPKDADWGTGVSTKISRKRKNADTLAEIAAEFLRSRGIDEKAELILPVPPSRNRTAQPTFLIADSVAERLELQYLDDLLVKTSTGEAKNFSSDEGVSIKQTKRLRNPCSIILMDDIFDSGKTLNACVKNLRKDPNTQDIFVLTMTKTKGWFVHEGICRRIACYADA